MIGERQDFEFLPGATDTFNVCFLNCVFTFSLKINMILVVRVNGFADDTSSEGKWFG